MDRRPRDARGLSRRAARQQLGAARAARATSSCSPRSKIRSRRRTQSRLDTKLVVEGANGPTSIEADAILAERGILVLPDVLTNAAA
jgi:hypothetical protein